MKKTLVVIAALLGLSACADNPVCMGGGDDVYRKRTRDYNWYDGRTEHYGETGKGDTLYHNSAKDGQWTKPE